MFSPIVLTLWNETMIYELAHYDSFGNADIQTFASLEDVQWEIDRLGGCLEDASASQSWRIEETIIQLKEMIAEGDGEDNS